MGQVDGWANYGPLTSAFIQPTDCTSLTLVSYTVERSYTEVQGSETRILPSPTASPQLHGLGPGSRPSCYPTQYQKSTPQITPAPKDLPSGSVASDSGTYYNTFFSPARCPEAWNTKKLNHDYTPQNDTLAVCCPPGYNVPNRGRGKGSNPLSDYTYCHSYLPTLSASDYSNPITALSNGSLTTIGLKDWSTIGGTGTGQTVTATGINVMWRLGDFPDIDAAESSASASASAAAGYSPPREGGLSTGTKIGLGAGIPMGVIFVAVIAFVIWHRKKMAKERETASEGWSGFRLKKDKQANLIIMPNVEQEGKGLLSEGGSSKGDAQPTCLNITRTEELASSENGIPEPVEAQPSPPPYDAAGSSTPNGSERINQEETDLEYEERRLKERKELLRERIQLARDEDALRTRRKS